MFGAPVVSEPIKIVGHSWLKRKDSDVWYCKDCGLEYHGIVTAPGNPRAEKMVRRTVTYYGRPYPTCDPYARR